MTAEEPSQVPTRSDASGRGVRPPGRRPRYQACAGVLVTTKHDDGGPLPICRELVALQAHQRIPSHPFDCCGRAWRTRTGTHCPDRPAAEQGWLFRADARRMLFRASIDQGASRDDARNRPLARLARLRRAVAAEWTTTIVSRSQGSPHLVANTAPEVDDPLTAVIDTAGATQLVAAHEVFLERVAYGLEAVTDAAFDLWCDGPHGASLVAGWRPQTSRGVTS
jgi:hypothetical protein